MKCVWSTMTPRERDALVAEKVMGWEPVSDPVKENEFIRHDPILIAGAGRSLRAFSPTVSISDAFEVVEKMQNGLGPPGCGNPKALCFDTSYQCGVEIEDYDSFYWVTNFRIKGYAHSKSLSESICLAALRACGVEVGE